MSRIAPRGLSLVWVVLISMVALDCSHAVGAGSSQVVEPADAATAAVASQVKVVGVRVDSAGVVTVFPDPVVVKKNQDILVFLSTNEPLSIQFKDDNNPFGEQPECRRRTCIFRVPAGTEGIFHYSVMVRGRTKDPRVEVQP